MPGAPTFSVVIPIFNEVESIGELVAGIDAVMARLGHSYEIVAVDDGSVDGSLETLKQLAARDRRIRVYSFRRNLGKSPALTCGFQHAAGAYVFTLDADLQDDPGGLEPMFAALTKGNLDVVSGWRKDRRDSIVKVLSSKVFNQLVMRLLFGWSLQDMNSGVKLYRSEVAKDLRLYGGMHRFIPLIAKELGYRVAEEPVTHHARKFGTSKYRPTKILTEVPDLLTLFFLTKYTRRPLHFFGRIGSALFVVGFVILAYLSYLWTQGIGIGTRPLLMLGVLLVLIGGQTVFTGLIADLIVNVNENRPQQFPIRYASDEDATAPTLRNDRYTV
jgi:glycosyltransferase involved in cell wall biosynthesis